MQSLSSDTAATSHTLSSTSAAVLAHDELWQRLCEFEFDAAGCVQTFSRRLASEQGWSHEFACGRFTSTGVFSFDGAGGTSGLSVGRGRRSVAFAPCVHAVVLAENVLQRCWAGHCVMHEPEGGAAEKCVNIGKCIARRWRVTSDCLARSRLAISGRCRWISSTQLARPYVSTCKDCRYCADRRWWPTFGSLLRLRLIGIFVRLPAYNGVRSPHWR